jgi:hypothetical protein
MFVFKLSIFIGFLILSFPLLTGCTPQEPPVKSDTKIAKETELVVKNLEASLKDPLVLKDSVLLHRQCAAFSFPGKLLVDGLAITRTNVYSDNKRLKVYCISINAESPRGIEKLGGDLIVFGYYKNLENLANKLPAGYIINIEQRFEKNQATIIPWIVKKP